MNTKKILSKFKKPALLNNDAPGMTKQDMNKLAKRWIEILLDQIQDFKNCKLPVVTSVKTLDN